MRFQLFLDHHKDIEASSLLDIFLRLDSVMSSDSQKDILIYIEDHGFNLDSLSILQFKISPFWWSYMCENYNSFLLFISALTRGFVSCAGK